MIIITGSGQGSSASRDKLINELHLYEARGGRVVVVGRDELPFSTVTLGYRAGAGKLADYLADKGYVRPILLGPPAGSFTGAEWEHGFVEAAKGRGVDISESDIHRATLTRDGARALVRRLARNGFGAADVVVAASDLTAIGAMTALRECGIQPGSQLAVTGFDNVVGAEDVTPQLTSVDLHLSQAGKAAVQLGLEDTGSRSIRHIEPELVIRSSSPPREQQTPQSAA